MEANKKNKKVKSGGDQNSNEKKKHSFKGKNPYLCFKDEYFKKLLNQPSASGEKKSHKDVMVEIGQKWKELTDEEKQKYKDLSLADQDSREKQQ